MKTPAYSELYLSDGKQSLAAMFDYAVNNCGVDCDRFAQAFVDTGYAAQFGIANPFYIAGMSGIELARLVMGKSGKVFEKWPEQTVGLDYSPEYWAGWVLAGYQWKSGLSFAEIFSRIPFSRIVAMYPLYHEMDQERFNEAMDNAT